MSLICRIILAVFFEFLNRIREWFLNSLVKSLHVLLIQSDSLLNLLFDLNYSSFCLVPQTDSLFFPKFIRIPIHIFQFSFHYGRCFYHCSHSWSKNYVLPKLRSRQKHESIFRLLHSIYLTFFTLLLFILSFSVLVNHNNVFSVSAL